MYYQQNLHYRHDVQIDAVGDRHIHHYYGGDSHCHHHVVGDARCSYCFDVQDVGDVHALHILRAFLTTPYEKVCIYLSSDQSPTVSRRFQSISEMCNKPSLPGSISTKQP